MERDGGHAGRVHQDAHVGLVSALRHRAVRGSEGLPRRRRQDSSLPCRGECTPSPVFGQAPLPACSHHRDDCQRLHRGCKAQRGLHSSLWNGCFALPASRDVRHDGRTGCQAGQGCAADCLRIARRRLLQDGYQAHHGCFGPRTGPCCSTWNGRREGGRQLCGQHLLG